MAESGFTWVFHVGYEYRANRMRLTLALHCIMFFLVGHI